MPKAPCLRHPRPAPPRKAVVRVETCDQANGSQPKAPPGPPYPPEGDAGEVDAESDDALVGEPATHLAPQSGRYVGRRFSHDRPVRVHNLVAGGISWRAMPADFPAWGRGYAFFRRWREHGLITEFHDRLCGKGRGSEGREAEPTAGIIDAQSVRAAATVPAASRGFDGKKKVPGRKRHSATDTSGLLLAARVTAATVGDRDTAACLLERLRQPVPSRPATLIR